MTGLPSWGWIDSVKNGGKLFVVGGVKLPAEPAQYGVFFTKCTLRTGQWWDAPVRVSTPQENHAQVPHFVNVDTGTGTLIVEYQYMRSPDNELVHKWVQSADWGRTWTAL